jgi:mono/diheme cytochrome c family protein
MTARWRAAALVVSFGAHAIPAVAVSGPALDYALNCQGCHRADGTGTPGTVPALAGSVAKFVRVPGGREYLGRVPGVSQAPLDDAALAAVLNWMLDRFDHADLPADFRPYTADEVGRLRADPLTDVTTRRALVEKIDRLK